MKKKRPVQWAVIRLGEYDSVALLARAGGKREMRYIPNAIRDKILALLSECRTFSAKD